MALGLTLIDEKLRELVVDLNAAGFATEASCQGRRHEHEFANETHSPAGYIAFAERMPDAAIALLEQRGRFVYAEGRAVASVWVTSFAGKPGTIQGYRRLDEVRSVEDWTEAAIRDVIAKNERFLDDVRDAFGVPETRRRDRSRRRRAHARDR